MGACRILLLTLALPFAAGAQQVPATSPAAPASSAQAASPSAVQPMSGYALLQPSLNTVEQALGSLRVDKWKAPGAVREAAAANINSIQKDLDGTLPGLVTKADASPGSVTDMLALSRNVDALYDVLLRVTDTAGLAAPEAQRAALDEALSGLLSARRTLGDRVESAAVAQEQKVRDLQKALTARPVAAPVVTAPVVAAANTNKAVKKTVKPPAKKKATAAASGSNAAVPKQ